MPEKYIGLVFAIIMVTMTADDFSGAVQSLVMPPSTDLKALQDNQTWRLLYFPPIVLMLLFIFSLVYFLNLEAPKFYLYENGQMQKAREAVHRIYRTEGNEFIATKIIKSIQKEADKETNKVGFIQAYCASNQYVRISWVSLGLTLLVIMNGWLLFFVIFVPIYAIILQTPASEVPQSELAKYFII